MKNLEVLLLITIRILLIYRHTEYSSLNYPFLPLHHILAYSQSKPRLLNFAVIFPIASRLPIRKRGMRREGTAGGQHSLSHALLR